MRMLSSKVMCLMSKPCHFPGVLGEYLDAAAFFMALWILSLMMRTCFFWLLEDLEDEEEEEAGTRGSQCRREGKWGFGTIGTACMRL